MMTRRKRTIIFLLILLALLLLLLWILFALFSRGQETVVVPEAEFVEEVEEVVEIEEVTRATLSDEVIEEEKEERTASADVVSLSKTFVERYGSYSNEAEFANLVDVLPLMSTSFATQTESFIETTAAPEGYYGVSTRVITVSVDQLDESGGRAQVTLTTQREEAVDSPQNITVKFQDIVLTFVMEGGVWKVDSATWQ